MSEQKTIQQQQDEATQLVIRKILNDPEIMALALADKLMFAKMTVVYATEVMRAIAGDLHAANYLQQAIYDVTNRPALGAMKRHL